MAKNMFKTFKRSANKGAHHYQTVLNVAVGNGGGGNWCSGTGQDNQRRHRWARVHSDLHPDGTDEITVH